MSFACRPPSVVRFAPGTIIPGQHRVAIITHGLWQRVFGGDRGVVGRQITLNGTGYEVIGVLPVSFRFATASLEILGTDGAAGHARAAVAARQS